MVKITISTLRDRVDELNDKYKLSLTTPCMFDILSAYGGYQIVLKANPPYRYYVYPVTLDFCSVKEVLNSVNSEDLNGNLSEDIDYVRFRIYKTYNRGI